MREEVQRKPTRREKKTIYTTRKKKKKKMMMMMVEPAAALFFVLFCLVFCGGRRWQAEEVGEIQCNTIQCNGGALLTR
jgi:hypothetical protein